MISQAMSEGSSYILILGSTDPRKEVPIVIGENEAQAIVMAVEGQHAKRPLTHNLMVNIMEEYMLTLQRVTIDRFEEGIFYASLHLSDGFSEKTIDSRTSDAIVLALLMNADILMDATTFHETCMEPDALTNNLPGNKKKTATGGISIEALEALLHECEENEDYERAQEIMDQINKLKKEEQS